MIEMNRNTMKHGIGLPALVALALFTGPAHAVDGVLEINQTCAEQTGCFPGDIAGFPVTIGTTTPGTSFRLTSDLVIPDTNPGGILIIAVNDVVIDLNGFSVVRAMCLVVRSAACMPTIGGTHGIAIDGGSESGTTVKNGSVIGMEGFGVGLADQSTITNVTARWNAADGIFANVGSIISGCTAQENGGHGITGAAAISGNTAVDNAGDGIVAFSGGLVERNYVRSNTGAGLNLSADAGYRGNVVTGNGSTVTGGVPMGANSCDGAATCP